MELYSNKSKGQGPGNNNNIAVIYAISACWWVFP